MKIKAQKAKENPVRIVPIGWALVKRLPKCLVGWAGKGLQVPEQMGKMSTEVMGK